MAIRDIEAFVRERAARFDSNLDISPGSPFDTQVIQPLVRRLGTDPFSVDISTFVRDRLQQAYPDMALDEGDALTDLLVKPLTLLWDPIVRETLRIKQNLSFKDPTVLTVDEAEALGANLFAERALGSLSRGMCRVSFKQPQSITVTPVNFCTSKGGLHFFPTEAQSIRVDEMLLNLATDGTYYFDFNLIAEAAGDQYNIGPGELLSIANIESATRVTNLRRFADGTNEDSAEDFVAKARGELTERSLVTLRGVSAQLTRAFPEIRRLNVVGFNDPEMQRDVLRGGGYGPILASGSHGTVLDDGENQAASRRFLADAGDTVNFTILIGPTTEATSGYILTVVEGEDSLTAPAIQDFEVEAVLNPTTLQLSEQRLGIGRTALRWSLRLRSLTLSGIPGGIVFPNGPQGSVVIKNDEVHVGGASDIYIRGTDFEEETLVLDAVTDDVVELSGVEAEPITDLFGAGVPGIQLTDLILGTDYSLNDDTFQLLVKANRLGSTLQIVTGPDSSDFGVYRIIKVQQTNGGPVKLQLLPNPTTTLPPSSPNNQYRWRLFEQINIDLLTPKETRVSEVDLITSQNFNVVRSGGGINYNDFGVAQDDVLEILNGPDAGRYTITAAPLAPGFDRLLIDAKLKNTLSAGQYTIYRPNLAGGIDLPLIRIKSIELLDSSNQPLGTTVPYARPIDVESQAFQNPGHGVKHTIPDVQLGIISQPAFGGFFLNPLNATLQLIVLHADGTSAFIPTISLPANAPPSTVISMINAALGPFGYPNSAFAFDSTRFAIRPTGIGLIISDGSAVSYLFGSDEPRTTADIRSASTPDWDALNPAVDYSSGLDIVQIVGGRQVGYYSTPFSGPASTNRQYYASFPNPSTALILRNISLPIAAPGNTRQFAPEENVRIELGSRSLGSARCFFLEPTSIEFNQDSFFSIETAAGLVRFLPDPTLSTQLIPALPSNTKSNDGSADGGGSTFTAASQNFLRSGVGTGDQLTIDYLPVSGTIVLSDPVANLAGKTLVFAIDDSPALTLTFIRDDVSLASTDVTRDGVAQQINARAGKQICSLSGSDILVFQADSLITVKPTGTANPLILGSVAGSIGPVSWSGLTPITNESPLAGEYIVASADATVLHLTIPLPLISSLVFPGPTLTEQGFSISRPGSQRISTTQMATQTAEAGLYYFDVELVSEGTGDLWNLDAGLQLSVTDFNADGYFLTTDDSNLTFSMAEKPKLVISKSVLEQGVDDDPSNATQIVGQNLQITYERSDLVGSVQAFTTSEIERVSVQSALARHLIPHFVRFDLNYVGGSTEDIVTTDINTYVTNLFPSEALESSDLQKIVSDRGADSIQNPIDIIAVVHNIDRSVTAARSQNALTTGRLAAFIPDLITIKRSTV